MNKNLFVAIVLLFLCGCSIVQFSGRDEVTNMRRPQQFAAIETGVPADKGTVQISGGYQCALERPRVLKYFDTTLDIGNSSVTSTSSVTTAYESLHTLNLNVAYSAFRLFSFGLLYDMSFGKLFTDTIVDPVVNNNLFELSFLVRFAVNLNRFTLGIRPELMLTTINYNTLIFTDSHFLAQDTQVRDPQFAFRNSLFARAKLTDEFSIFIGFQLRMMPFSINNEEVDYDVQTGIYGGFGFHIAGPIYLDPYCTLPFRAPLSHHRSPISAGVRVTFVPQRQ